MSRFFGLTFSLTKVFISPTVSYMSEILFYFLYYIGRPSLSGSCPGSYFFFYFQISFSLGFSLLILFILSGLFVNFNYFKFTLHPNYSLLPPLFPIPPLQIPPSIAPTPSCQRRGVPFGYCPTLGHLVLSH